MPAIMIETIRFDDRGRNFYVSLRELAERLPHIKEDGDIEFFVVEIRDERDKLIKRFKPFAKLRSKVGSYWDGSRWNPVIYFSQDEASKLNLANNYRVALLLTEFNKNVLFPFELRAVGYYQPERILEGLSKIESELLLLNLKVPPLDQVVAYIWDSNCRLEENDIEGARTSLRNSLQVLGKFISKVAPLAEAEDFKDNLGKLSRALAGFLHYGGAHPGPAPRRTTEMVMELTIAFVNYLAKAMEDKTIKLEEVPPVDKNEAK